MIRSADLFGAARLMLFRRFSRGGGGSLLPRVQKLVYRAAQRVIVLDISRVLWLERDALRPPEPLGPPCDYRFLTPAETRWHALEPANDLEPALAERMLAGRDLCYAALDGQRLASYIWLALGSIEPELHRGEHPDTGVGISWPDDVAFVYKAFTRHEYRGRRLYPACIAHAFDELSPLGVHALLSTTDWLNAAALRSFRRLGFRDLGLIWRFGARGRMLTRPPLAAKRLGVKFDPYAVVQPRQVAVDGEWKYTDPLAAVYSRGSLGAEVHDSAFAWETPLKAAAQAPTTPPKIVPASTSPRK